jgi:hypothetical protein
MHIHQTEIYNVSYPCWCWHPAVEIDAQSVLRSMLAQSLLTEDLWVDLATYLTIEDLYSLCGVSDYPAIAYVMTDSCLGMQTCRHLRGTLSESKTVWLNVIRDLLVLSPNITVARSLKAASASDLKRTCDRYYAANRLLDMESLKKLGYVISTKDQYCSYAIPFTALEEKLIPGLACIAYASANGSVHLVSTKTGEVMDTWSHPEVDAFKYVRIQTCSCEAYGVTILVVSKLNEAAYVLSTSL